MPAELLDNSARFLGMNLKQPLDDLRISSK
jgi:hypothetical protein